MFHELDDPTPPPLGDSLRRKVRAGVRTRRRRQAAVGGAAGAVVLGVGGLYAQAASRISGVERIEIADGGPGASTASSDDVSTDPTTVMFVGVDRAAGLDGSGPISGSPAELGLADTIIVARLDPVAGTVRMLSIPRDLEVTSLDGSTSVRINSVLATDGPSGLIDVVASQIGISIDHYVMVDFGGFRDLVDRMDGVQVDVLMPMRDEYSGLDLPTTGCIDLDASQALALVRSRHVETFVDGQWRADTSGDTGLWDRQRVFLLATLERVRSSLGDPLELEDIASWVAADGVTLGSGLDVETLVELARSGLSIDAGDVTGIQLPAISVTRFDGAAVLHATQLGAVAAWFEAPSTPDGSGPSATPVPTQPLPTSTVGPCD